MKCVFVIISTVLVLCFVACNNHSVNWETLSAIESYIEDDSDSALAVLKEIDCDTLSELDRIYYHFLTVKAMDNAYVIHTTDSLILLVHEYFSHYDKARYPEVAYYCGRVYDDLGDYPTALNYYQKALDLLPPEQKNLKLRGAVLSQIGRLLNSIRLYEQAIPYLNEVISIDSALHDSTNLMLDIHRLGAIKMHMKKYFEAEILFKQARALAFNQNQAEVARLDVYLAGIKFHTGVQDSALMLIRSALNRLHTIDRNFGLAYATHIYLKLGILDTAFMYATELVKSTDSNNKATGYQILLSPKFRDYINGDSLYKIIAEYRWLFENSLNRNESQAALLQNSYYNYKIHERERIRAEAYNATLQRCILGVAFVLLCLVILVLYLKYRNKSQQFQLQKAINDIGVLRQNLIKSGGESQGRFDNVEISSRTDINALRTRLKEELLSIISGNESQDVSIKILESSAYDAICQFIRKSKVIPESHKLWEEVESVVVKSSPNFKYRLQLLVGEELKTSDLHMALLIKCGIKPTNISILMGRAKATIAYRREALGTKFFGQKIGVTTIDKIIRLL